MWMGGTVPLGYRVENRKLIIQENEAATVRMIFERFLPIGSATILARTLNAEGITSRGGRPIDKGYLYKLLNNRVYIGEAVHKGTSYPGEHQPIIARDLWDKVRSIIAESPAKRAGASRGQTPALLRGLIFAPNGYAMTPAHTRKKGKLYRYYVTTSVQKLGPDTCPVRRLPAGEIEAAVIDQVRAMLRSPEMIVKTWAAAREQATTTSAKPRCATRSFSSMRSGTNCSRPSRHASSSCWSSGSMSVSTASPSGYAPRALPASSPSCGRTCRRQPDAQPRDQR